MASELGVQTIQHTNGTDAMTIDSSGYVSMPNTTELDIWNLPANVSITSSTTQDITTFTRWDVDWEKIGTGMSHSSGIFTFPSTGKWRCTAKIYWQSSNNGLFFGIVNRFSTDGGSTFTDRAYAYQNAENLEYADTSTIMYVDVTDVSTARAKFSIQTHASGTLGGNTSQLRTYVVFEKLAAT